VGGGVAGGAVVLDVDVMLEVVLDDVGPGAADVVDVAVVVDAERVREPPVAPQALKMATAARMISDRAPFDTSRRSLRGGLCARRVTILSISAPAAAVIGRGEASPLLRRR
jgi:hypothetical protein